jgi:hypothetical protein
MQVFVPTMLLFMQRGNLGFRDALVEPEPQFLQAHLPCFLEWVVNLLVAKSG